MNDICYGDPLLYLPKLSIELYLLSLIENEFYGVNKHPSIDSYIDKFNINNTYAHHPQLQLCFYDFSTYW